MTALDQIKMLRTGLGGNARALLRLVLVSTLPIAKVNCIIY